MPRIVGVLDIILFRAQGLYTLYSPTVKKPVRYTGPAFVKVSLMQKLALEYKVETKILEQSLRVKSLWVLYCCPTFKSEHHSQTPIHLYIRAKCALKFKKTTTHQLFSFLIFVSVVLWWDGWYWYPVPFKRVVLKTSIVICRTVRLKCNCIIFALNLILKSLSLYIQWSYQWY